MNGEVLTPRARADGPFQLYELVSCALSRHLHEHIYAPDLPLHHGPEQGRVRIPCPESRSSQALTSVNHPSFIGIFWKCARIGERLSPYVSIFCVFMAVCATPPRGPYTSTKR